LPGSWRLFRDRERSLSEPPRRVTKPARKEATVSGTPGRRCANPACDRLVSQAATGRPARYCCPACRQAGHRVRLRLAAEAAQRAARLADARATCEATWGPLEETCDDAAEAARAVLCYAAGGTRADL